MSPPDMRQTLAIMRQAERDRWTMPSAQPVMGGAYEPPVAQPTGPVSSRVVSPSTPPSQVRHTTPSPEASDEETARARRESLEAQRRAGAELAEGELAERRRQMELLRQALAEFAPKTRLRDESR